MAADPIHATLSAPLTADAVAGRPSEVRWLIDNAAAYDALLDAIGRARRTLWISQLALDADCVAHARWVRGEASPGGKDRPILAAVIAASARRGMDVRVMLNASLLLDTAKTLRAALERAGATRVAVRGISRFPSLLHAKLVIVDEVEAFLLGSPFVNGYWDDPSHRPVDARRPTRELGGRPLHDVSFSLTGGAARDVARIFTQLWDEVSVESGSDRDVVAPARDGDEGNAVGPDDIGIVVTAPARMLRRHPRGRTEILDAIVSGIDSAGSLIYIEHQYLSARPVVAALVRALMRAPDLEVVMVLNQNPDITAYRGWQNARLAESGLLRHPRVGLFTLWSAEPCGDAADRWAVNQVFVHSKVLMVDDCWATVGSANLDGVSLHSYGDDFVGWLGRRVFAGVRNIDVNVVITDPRGDISPPVRNLRERLWAEHLGPGAWTDAGKGLPMGGWLARWRESGVQSAAALNAGPTHSTGRALRPTFVLPYSTGSTPVLQLADAGVVLGTAPIDLRFNPGWLEVHCSPNWIRNMFG